MKFLLENAEFVIPYLCVFGINLPSWDESFGGVETWVLFILMDFQRGCCSIFELKTPLNNNGPLENAKVGVFLL